MNLGESEAELVGIDWGTSSLRAYLLDEQGLVLDHKHSHEGIMRLPDRDFERVLHHLIDPWLQRYNLSVVVSGMITSRNGWLETPYQPVPVSVNDLAQSLLPLTIENGEVLHMVSGVTAEHSGAPDVMRGEETQIVGAIHAGLVNGMLVLPGTHSKWVTVKDGCVTDFSTFMTGEIYEALSKNTILGTLMKDASFCRQQFIEGVRKGISTGSRLLHELFHVRTLPLFDKLNREAVADYLSGLLIGAELQGATEGVTSNTPVIIVGRSDLADRYEIAFAEMGQISERAPDDIVAQGHFAIATTAGLLT